MRFRSARRPSTFIEALEPRIAPAVLVSPLSVTYTDVDGDLVTITVSKGDLKDRVAFEGGFGSAESGNQQLLMINLADSRFTEADLTISVTAVQGGDGLMNFGYLNAKGVSLGEVDITGSVNKIAAGRIASDLAIASLDLHSLGNTSKFGAPNLKSTILGSVGPVLLTGSINEASLVVTGSISDIYIEGSIFGGELPSSGSISTTGNIASLRFNSLEGGSDVKSGRVSVGGNLGPVRFIGALRGGSEEGSGVIDVRGNLQSIQDFDYGNGGFIGGSARKTGSVIVRGSVGQMFLGASSGGPEFESGLIRVDGSVNEIFVESMVGGAGFRSGSIWVKGVLSKVTVANNMTGGAGELSGSVRGGALIGSLGIDNVIGGTGKDAGSISSIGGIANVNVGQLTSGFGDGSGSITTSGKIGTMLVTRSVTGSASHPVTISALGLPFFKPGDPISSTIDSVTINGSATYLNIMAGYDVNRAAGNPDAQIGTVHVLGDVSGTNIIAGAVLKKGKYKAIPGGSPIILSKIGNVIIDGLANSTTELDDLFKIVSQQINRVSVSGVDVPLTPLAQNDKDMAVGTATDFLIQEI